MAKWKIIPLLLGIALVIAVALGTWTRVKMPPTPVPVPRSQHHAPARATGLNAAAQPTTTAALSPVRASSPERDRVRALLWNEVIGPTSVLHLSSPQIERLMDDIIAARDQLQQVEAALPRTVQRDDTKAVISLPPYPEAGYQIQVHLFAQLEQDFPAQAQAIETATRDDLNQLFSYFGQTRQTFVVERQADTGRLVLAHGAYRGTGKASVPIEMTNTVVGTDDEFRTGVYAYLYPVVAGLK